MSIFKGSIGSMVGSGLKIGSSIFGGIKASKAMNRVRDNIKAARTENTNWYNRRYNEDATQRADAQSLLNNTRELLLHKAQNAAATNAVMGGTDEAAALDKADSNNTLANTIDKLNTAADARKDRIENDYRTRDEGYQSKLNDLEISKAKAIKDAVNGAATAAGDIAQNF